MGETFDFREYFGRMSPKILEINDEETEESIYLVIVATMPSAVYSIHLADHTLYRTIPDMPEFIRTNLLLIKGRYGADMTGVEHKIIQYPTYATALQNVLLPAKSSYGRGFVDIGYMAAPGVYCVSVNSKDLHPLYTAAPEQEKPNATSPAIIEFNPDVYEAEKEVEKAKARLEKATSWCCNFSVGGVN